ncbi:hypothetical protein ABZ897_44775 [Nonomuraea sp. NPDC046802]|uniref:hypothetical protein n=1 Tax=Nonomuraea sp. NPDC046802 TaxID=3154919 RepID=UPI0033DDAF54
MTSTTEHHRRVINSEHPSTLRIQERRSRLRVKVAGRMGQADFWHHETPSTAVVRQAMIAAARGPLLALELGANYASNMEELSPDTTPTKFFDLPDSIDVVTHRRSVHFVTAAGTTLRWDHVGTRVVLGVRCARRQVPVAVLDARDASAHSPRALPPVFPVPARRKGDRLEKALLWSPIALSALLTPPLQSRICHGPGKAADDLARHVSLLDDGRGAPTDLEGTRRKRIDLLVQPIRTLVSASDVRHLTGHGGVLGPELEYLTVLPHTVRETPESSACHVVAQARPIPAFPGLAALVVLAENRPASVVIAQLPDPMALLQSGQWVAPLRSGSGLWRSPWLELPDPRKALEVIHVEEDS